MPSIAWTSVFLLLVVELFLTFLLVLPLPKSIRRFFAKKIFTYSLGNRIRVTANFIFFGLLLAVADAISGLRHITEKEEKAQDVSPGYPEGQGAYISLNIDKQRKFRAERNMYLAGFALTLGFVITRLIELMQEMVSGEEERESLNKRIAALEAETHMNHTTSPEEDDSQGGTPMDTMASMLTSSGIRRRAASNGSESTTTEVTDKTD